MKNPAQPVDDGELKSKVLADFLIHEESCAYSLYDGKCDCIQLAVAKNISEYIMPKLAQSYQSGYAAALREAVGGEEL